MSKGAICGLFGVKFRAFFVAFKNNTNNKKEQGVKAKTFKQVMGAVVVVAGILATGIGCEGGNPSSGNGGSGMDKYEKGEKSGYICDTYIRAQELQPWLYGDCVNDHFDMDDRELNQAYSQAVKLRGCMDKADVWNGQHPDVIECMSR
jgi:hypothetical protein